TGGSRVDDPGTANTGVGARTYDDRGAYEYQPGGSPTPTPTPTPSSPTPTPTSPSPSPTATGAENPLTLYFTDTTTPALSGARKMVPVEPAAETSHQNVFGTATGWGSVWPGGNGTAWSAAGSEPAVNTHGFLYDATELAGVTLLAGSYAPSLKVKVASNGVSASFTTRVWLRHSDGTFALLAKYDSGTVTLTTTPRTIAAWSEVQAQTDTTTATGDRLFLDLAADIVTNTAGSATNAFTMSLNGGAAESLVTPGYTTPAGAGS
ncbi:MAG: hypothetical protein QOF82_1062, partial [Frankiales bacterium]|nr:hypothetical protein [Frankiales bacterium]